MFWIFASLFAIYLLLYPVLGRKFAKSMSENEKKGKKKTGVQGSGEN
jgi:membrane protein implicated in regulation of membrane protease activity